ncbi:hypothetical protein GQX74_012263 [Glossina fuscipes]|nr:hypothetical protein GQX74_012263 [Glossina fuscipes]
MLKHDFAGVGKDLDSPANWRDYSQPMIGHSSLTVFGNLALRLTGILMTFCIFLLLFRKNKAIVNSVSLFTKILDELILLDINVAKVLNQGILKIVSGARTTSSRKPLHYAKLRYTKTVIKPQFADYIVYSTIVSRQRLPLPGIAATWHKNNSNSKLFAVTEANASTRTVILDCWDDFSSVLRSKQSATPSPRLYYGLPSLTESQN